MNNLNTFIKEQLERKGVAREYYRLAPFYRLADQLILLRKKRGLTQQELAEKAQTTQAVVSRLENVSVHCSLESVVRLAEALDAVVDVRLIPSEELNTAEAEPVEKEPYGENEDTNKGIVFFGQASKKTRQNMVWSTFNLYSSQVLPHQEQRKQKVLEIA